VGKGGWWGVRCRLWAVSTGGRGPGPLAGAWGAAAARALEPDALAARLQGPPDQRLALPLLVLLAQQRRIASLSTSASQLKFITEYYDRWGGAGGRKGWGWMTAGDEIG
jgi:hypothetical protein